MLAAAVLLGLLMVVASTIMGALLVEAGQAFGATGRVSSVREFVSGGCSLIAGPLGGWLASRAFGLTAGIGAGLLISLAVAAFFLLKNSRSPGATWASGPKPGSKCGGRWRRGRCGRRRACWSCSSSRPASRRRCSTVSRTCCTSATSSSATLQFWSGGAAMLGAATYGLVCRRFNLRTLLFVGIAISAGFSLLYLGYHPTHLAAIGIEIVVGFFGTLGVLPLFDLATRATPRGGEGMGYALMMSARNLALFGADWVGSYLQDHFHLPWNGLVFLNAGTTALCLIVVPFLPRLLMRHRDGEDLGDAHSTGEQISGPAPVAMHSA